MPDVKAHMPGLVARVVVEKGEQVKEGQEVAVINCMKNEYPVLAEEKGAVSEIHVQEWDEVEVGTPMVTLN